jgi:hypothetical protein
MKDGPMPLLFWLPLIMLNGMARVFDAETAKTVAALAPRKRD